MGLNVKTPFFLTQRLRQRLEATVSPNRATAAVKIGSLDDMQLNPWQTRSHHAWKVRIPCPSGSITGGPTTNTINRTTVASSPSASSMRPVVHERSDDMARAVRPAKAGRDANIACAATNLATRSSNEAVGAKRRSGGELVYTALAASIDE